MNVKFSRSKLPSKETSRSGRRQFTDNYRPLFRSTLRNYPRATHGRIGLQTGDKSKQEGQTFESGRSRRNSLDRDKRRSMLLVSSIGIRNVRPSSRRKWICRVHTLRGSSEGEIEATFGQREKWTGVIGPKGYGISMVLEECRAPTRCISRSTHRLPFPLPSHAEGCSSARGDCIERIRGGESDSRADSNLRAGSTDATLFPLLSLSLSLSLSVFFSLSFALFLPASFLSPFPSFSLILAELPGRVACIATAEGTSVVKALVSPWQKVTRVARISLRSAMT